MSFSETLRALLEEKNMSQADLCRQTGIPTSLISNYVRGVKSPSLTNSLKLAKVFQITVDELSGINLVDPTVLGLNEYPLVAKYRLLTPTEQAETDVFIDSLLVRSGRSAQKKPIPANKDELFEKLINSPRRLAFIEQLMTFDSAALARVEKILDIVENSPAALSSDTDPQ